MMLLSIIFIFLAILVQDTRGLQSSLMYLSSLTSDPKSSSINVVSEQSTDNVETMTFELKGYFMWELQNARVGPHTFTRRESKKIEQTRSQVRTQLNQKTSENSYSIGWGMSAGYNVNFIAESGHIDTHLETSLNGVHKTYNEIGETSSSENSFTYEMEEISEHTIPQGETHVLWYCKYVDELGISFYHQTAYLLEGVKPWELDGSPISEEVASVTIEYTVPKALYLKELKVEFSRSAIEYPHVVVRDIAHPNDVALTNISYGFKKLSMSWNEEGFLFNEDSYIWLEPIWTHQVEETNGLHAFDLVLQEQKTDDVRYLRISDGEYRPGQSDKIDDNYRYLVPQTDSSSPNPIVQIFLYRYSGGLRTELPDGRSVDKHCTPDINKDRGGGYLHLCWITASDVISGNMHC